MMEGADWNIGPCDLTAFVEEKSDLSNKKMLYQHGPVPLLNSHFLKSSYKKTVMKTKLLCLYQL